MADRSAVASNSDMKAVQHVVEPRHVFTFGLISSMFFAWGLAANMTDTLLAAFKRILSLSDFQTTFVQYAYFGAYFCFAIPASILVKRFGYKAGILVGLGLYISRQLAERYGGSLVVESSALEAGTVFALALPLAGSA